MQEVNIIFICKSITPPANQTFLINKRGRASRGKSAGQTQFVQQMHNMKLIDLKNEGQSDAAEHPKCCH